MGDMLAVDVGGTFTDVVSVRDGSIEVIKIPTDHSSAHASVVEGARALGASERAVFNHASTAGLNALLTRALPKVGFITTDGHRDLLDIGRCWRPFEALTDGHWRKSFGDAASPLVPRYLRCGVRERMLATGEALIGLDEEQARSVLGRLKHSGIEGLAICLLNSYVNPEHEVRLRELAAEVLGDIPCSISSFASPLAKEYPRATTTVVDVLMKIIFGKYTVDLVTGLERIGFDGELNFADSAAALSGSAQAMERPFKLVFAGPAAGTVASAHLGDRAGFRDMLCCDVGGTSSDISVVTDGRPVLNTAFELEPDLLVSAPSIEISSIGAGGGSIIAATAGGEIQVGPASAGARPGPACYGRGGLAPTMTDAFLLIGLLDPDNFNAGKLSLDADLSRAAFERLQTPLTFGQRIEHGYRLGLNNVAQGLLDVAIRHGIDPRTYTLVSFGAAGSLILPAVLGEVTAERVVVPPMAGLFSAIGLLSTDLVYSDSQTGYRPLDSSAATPIGAIFEAMERGLRSQAGGAVGTMRRSFDGQLVGQSWETPFVAVPDGDLDEQAIETMTRNFHDAYESRFGNRFEDYPIEAVTYRVSLTVPSQKIDFPDLDEGADIGFVDPDRRISLSYLDEANREAGEYQREDLPRGSKVRGPAVIRESTSTVHVPAGQTARIGRLGEIVIAVEGPPSPL